VHVSSPAGEVSRRLDLSGGRAGVRARAATAALHLIRDHVAALAAPAAR